MGVRTRVVAKVVCISYTPLRLLDLRHFFATRKEVTEKNSTL